MPPLTDEARERLAKAFPALARTKTTIEIEPGKHKCPTDDGFNANDLPF